MKRSVAPSRTSLGVAVVAGLLLAAPAMAHPPGGPDGPPDGHSMVGHFRRDLEKLGLSADQDQQVQAILDAAKAQREQQRSQMEAAMDQMHTLLEADPPDENAIMQQADKIGTLKTAGHKAMLHTLLQVRNILTPDQRNKLKAMRQEGPPPWHRHHGPPPPED
ncbi:MAG TPA: Spy/CpxP family protein refolding chaperone [Candidatus Acidoferrales bacterium]|nr:Spy/CpxP family protein refolding chaperone [Candidatus Acidoferrales bacterium]